MRCFYLSLKTYTIPKRKKNKKKEKCNCEKKKKKFYGDLSRFLEKEFFQLKK